MRASIGLLASALIVVASNARADESPPPSCATPPAASPPLAGRIASELLVGTGLATVGFLVGPQLTGAACRQCLYAAGLAGANALFPMGVYWGGRTVRGEGSFWATSVLPWAVSVATVVALARDQETDGSPAFEIGGIGGAIAAPLSIALFELTSWASVRKRTWAPTAVVAPHRGGATLAVGATL